MHDDHDDLDANSPPCSVEGLELFTTTDLLNELMSRNTNSIFMASTPAHGSQHDITCRWWGDMFGCLGLTAYMQQVIGDACGSQDDE